MAYRATFSTGSVTTYVTVVNVLWLRELLQNGLTLLLAFLIFLLFINDLPNVIPEFTSTGLYADDTKLYKAIRSRIDCTHLQEALTCAEDWRWECNINFNPSKCKILTIARGKTPCLTNYHLDAADLKRVTSEVDLGVTVTSCLSWNTPIKNIAVKAKRRTCPLLTDCVIRRSLYLSLVKSQLCNATEVWPPSILPNKINLEQVQRRGTRWILQLKKGEMEYKDRLLALNLLSLVYDRD